MKRLALLLALTACTHPVAVQHAEPMQPPAAFVAAYEATALCLGLEPNVERVTWYRAAITHDGRTRLGAWERPHRIYLDPRLWQRVDQTALDAVGHEALHDLTDSPEHDVAPECDPW
jgi:hypothetical protein